MLSQSEIQEFRKRLNERYTALREAISRELRDSDDEHFIDLAGQVHDLEEESVADLLVDVELAVIDLHVEEVRDIDAALMRIARGEYGVCTDCSADIAVERLKAYPTAKRCQPCQQRYENSHGGTPRHSL